MSLLYRNYVAVMASASLHVAVVYWGVPVIWTPELFAPPADAVRVHLVPSEPAPKAQAKGVEPEKPAREERRQGEPPKSSPSEMSLSGGALPVKAANPKRVPRPQAAAQIQTNSASKQARNIQRRAPELNRAEPSPTPSATAVKLERSEPVISLPLPGLNSRPSVQEGNTAEISGARANPPAASADSGQLPPAAESDGLAYPPSRPDYAAMVSSVRDGIDAAKRYPRLARQAGFEGRVLLKFKILPSGEVAELRVLESSGYELLDEAALGAVRRAGPFPEEGRKVEGQWIEVILPVVFELR